MVVRPAALVLCCCLGCLVMVSVVVISMVEVVVMLCGDFVMWKSLPSEVVFLKGDVQFFLPLQCS